MKYATQVVLLVAIAAFGCGAGNVTLHLVPDTQKVKTVEFDTSFASKGCAAMEIRKDGWTRLLIKQAGTSDWITGRTLGYVADIAGSMPILGGGGPAARKGGAMQGPTGETDGCEEFFALGANQLPDNILLIPDGVSEEDEEAVRQLLESLAPSNDVLGPDLDR
jgi:hypothetical protein